jgi:hypothetical protein
MQSLQELLDEIDASIEMDKLEQPYLDRLDKEIATTKEKPTQTNDGTDS